jgi:predicted RND superfamily exporter protein
LASPIDDTIHFLAKYRQELDLMHWDLRTAVYESIRETGVSMMYTSIILFFGFAVFASSNFGGTQALGVLTSITLLIAMLVNLVLLPSILLSMGKRITTKAFREPFIEVIDEETDIDFTGLSIPPEKDK